MNSNSGSTDAEIDDNPTGTPTETAGNHTPTDSLPEGVDVEDVAVRKGLFAHRDTGRDSVYASNGEQHVVASVRSGDGVSSNDFVLETDGDSWAPAPSDEYNRYGSLGDRGARPINPRHPEHRWTLVFDVPAPLSGSNPRLTYSDPGGSSGDEKKWPLPTGSRERLATPAPAFELVELNAPKGVEYGETLSIPITVRNTSDIDGRFLAMAVFPTRIADDDESVELSTGVPAGETSTVTCDIDTAETRIESNPVTVEIRGHVSASRRIEVNGYPHNM